MTFLTNWVFWVIVIAIIIIMALIGYLAEGTELDSKSKKKNKETNTETPKNVEEVALVTETNEPSAWTGEIQKDERHEQTHDVPSIDDWTTIPTDTIENNTISAETIQNNNDTQMFSEMTPNSTTPNTEPINPAVLENLDAPLTDIIAEKAPVVEAISTLEPSVEVPTEIKEETKVVENPVPETLDTTIETLETTQTPIEPAPIFDVPNLEPQVTETPKEEPVSKNETTEDIWK